jgi:glucosamine--fructose-6-phosphate aminotransferase (isomerizing)
MKPLGQYTLEEILSQAQTWQEAWNAVNQEERWPMIVEPRGPSRRIYFTGCGSTYYLALAGAAHLRRLAQGHVQAVPASELWLDAGSYFQKDDVLIAISRSGTTTETLRAADAFRTMSQGPLISIQCAVSAPLAQKSAMSVVIPGGAERSVAQTRSFASMLVAVAGLNVHWAERDDLIGGFAALPRIGQRVITAGQALAREWGARLEFDRIYFLGSGTRYGLACEASLKMKEMSLSHSEPFHFLEFRHGPKAMVTETTLIVGLVSGYAQAEEERVLREMAGLGAQVIVLGERVSPIGDGPALSFQSGLPDELQDVLYLPPLQLLAFERALAKGLDPDLPRHLEAVVVL